MYADETDDVNELFRNYALLIHQIIERGTNADYTWTGVLSEFARAYDRIKENSGQPTAPVGPFVIQGRKVGRDKWCTWNAYGDDDIESPLVFETYDAANNHLNSSRLPAVYGNYEYRVIPATES